MNKKTWTHAKHTGLWQNPDATIVTCQVVSVSGKSNCTMYQQSIPYRGNILLPAFHTEAVLLPAFHTEAVMLPAFHTEAVMLPAFHTEAIYCCMAAFRTEAALLVWPKYHKTILFIQRSLLTYVAVGNKHHSIV